MKTIGVEVKTKDILTLEEISSEQILEIIQLAIDMKQRKRAYSEVLRGKILGMIFEKPSTRTRASFEAGILQLGGQAIVMSGKDMQLGRGETIADTAKVLSEYMDGIMIRTFSDHDVQELAKHASIPVINGLTDLHHPCQALADMMTIFEQSGTFQQVKLAYVGDGNNVLHSLLIAAAKIGLHIHCATPQGFEPNEQIVQKAKEIAKTTGAIIELGTNPIQAVESADYIYTDVWASMGEEGEREYRLDIFSSYQINKKLVSYAKNTYGFLHCLPAHRGEEVTADIIDGSNSLVFAQAGNRLHAQKALLVTLMK